MEMLLGLKTDSTPECSTCSSNQLYQNPRPEELYVKAQMKYPSVGRRVAALFKPS